jgi:glycosyltransferase involved in cell wall biosynthesis
MNKPLVSIIMPTYKHEKFIRRAVSSLYDQTFKAWELLIINDGSPDNTYDEIKDFLHDERIHYWQNEKNCGAGACLNFGINKARSSYISYLPSDDVIYKDHLQTLFDALQQHEDAVLAYASVRHFYNRKTNGIINNEWLQLVQVMHKKTKAKWTTRTELESDDLNKLFWNKLAGAFIHTNQLTCEWVAHPEQRYKIMREPVGGINTFRSYYNVQEPLRYHTTKGNFIDEITHYANMRNRASTPLKQDGLKILIVGELAYNADRVLALEEQGNKLYGLWINKPYWYNWVGPLPFGHVEDIDRDNWKEEVKRIQPDIIYALLNWQVVPFAHKVMQYCYNIPFVWHFKEGPFICLEKGTWNELVDLYENADGLIHISEEVKWWLDDFIHKKPHVTEYILDGDLPKKDWFDDECSSLLSEKDGALHTVVPGRPIGLHPHNVKELADENIHLHFYGDFTQDQWREWIDKTNMLAPGYLHIHPNVDQENWVKEFSQYDAGWLHFFKSENFSEIKRANWDDLNIPARISTLILSGLPVLQADNTGNIVATQTLVKKLNVGLFFNDMKALSAQLRDKNLMQQLRKNVWRQRHLFTFDHHAASLLNFFKQVIKQHKANRSKTSKLISLMNDIENSDVVL